MWWNSNNGNLYVYYYDGDSYQWVTGISSIAIIGATGATYPTSTPTLTGATGLTLSNAVIFANCTTGSFIITLPPVSTSTNSMITIKKIDSTANTVTVKGNAAELIDNSNTQIISTQWVSITVVCNGSNWYIV